MAAEVLSPKTSSEQRLFQAIVLQAFEDALTTQGSKQESYLKKDAHDWFLDKNKAFEEVCWFAGLFIIKIISQKGGGLLVVKINSQAGAVARWLVVKIICRAARAAGVLVCQVGEVVWLVGWL